jgi:preprotein translocase subunit SecA
LVVDLPIRQWLEENPDLPELELHDRVLKAVEASYQAKLEKVGPGIMHQVEKSIMLQVLDGLWREHLAAMDYLRQGIHLRGYAQKNPKQEYKREAFEMFSELLDRLKQDTILLLHKLQVQQPEDVEAVEQQGRPSRMEFHHDDPSESSDAAPVADDFGADGVPKTIVREAPKVGRNDPCPCGSGKKYKSCHGRLV